MRTCLGPAPLGDQPLPFAKQPADTFEADGLCVAQVKLGSIPTCAAQGNVEGLGQQMRIRRVFAEESLQAIQPIGCVCRGAHHHATSQAWVEASRSRSVVKP